MEYSSFERTRKRKEQKPVVVAAASDAVEAAKRAKSVVVAGAPMVSELDQRKWYEEAADELVTMDRSIWKWVVDVVVVGSSTDSAISESIVLLVRR